MPFQIIRNDITVPEKCYEVRTEDTAVDVQIHKVPNNTEMTGAKSRVTEEY